MLARHVTRRHTYTCRNAGAREETRENHVQRDAQSTCDISISNLKVLDLRCVCGLLPVNYCAQGGRQSVSRHGWHLAASKQRTGALHPNQLQFDALDRGSTLFHDNFPRERCPQAAICLVELPDNLEL